MSKHFAIQVGKYGLLALVLLTVLYPARSQRTQTSTTHQPVTLPTLNAVQSVTLSPPYSCNNEGLNYNTDAIFLSDYSKQVNSPELLFNGACGSEDYFDVNTAGDSMSLIADLGNTPLNAVTTHKAFNLQNVFSWTAYSQFARVAKIVPGHTYAAVINMGDRRGLFVFNVEKFVPDREVDLQYTVKNYQVNLGAIQRSPGFDWNQ
jgi:hypothetical protein